MKRLGVTSVLLLTLVLASPSAGEAQVLRPGDLCSDHPDTAIATFEDVNLEARVRAALSVGERDDLTCGLASGLMALSANDAGIESLVGIQNLNGVTFLNLGVNSITGIGALRGLTSVERLHLDYNSITDISPLSGLTSLNHVQLDDVSPAAGTGT